MRLLHLLVGASACFCGSGDLLGWLHDQEVAIPSGIKMSLPTVGDVVTSGGTCHDVMLHNMTVQDNAALPGELFLDIVVTDLEARCTIEMQDTEGKSLIFHAVGIVAKARLVFKIAPGTLLGILGPFGRLEAQCELRIDLRSLTVRGDSPKIGLLKLVVHGPLSGGGSLQDNVLGVVEHIVSRQVCDSVRKSSELVRPLLDNLTNSLEPWLNDPSPAQPVGNVVDWGVYPPFKFVAALARERLKTLVHDDSRFNMPVNISDVSGIGAGNLTVKSILAGGSVVPDNYHVRLNGTQDVLETFTHIRRVNVTLPVSLTVKPLKFWLEAAMANFTGRSLQALNNLEGDRNFLKDMQITADLQDVRARARVSTLFSSESWKELVIDQAQDLACVLDCAQVAASPPNRPVTILDMGANVFSPSNSLTVTGLNDPLEFGMWALTQAIAKSLLGSPGEEEALFKVIRGFTNSYIEKTVQTHPDCPPTEVDLGIPITSLLCQILAVAFFVCGAVCAASTLVCCWGVACCPHSRQRSSFRKLTVEPSDDVGGPRLETVDEEAASASDSENTATAFLPLPRTEEGSLCSHPVVPEASRAFIPFALVSTLFAFFYSYFDIGTLVIAIFTADGQTDTLGPVFAFSLAMAIEDAWASGATFIAVLLLVLCGIWPVVKLALLACAWAMPTRCLSIKARGNLLYWLDLCGYVSLIDTWLGILVLGAFSFAFESAERKGTGFEIRVVPKVPFFAFVLATVASLALGHYMSEVHLRTILWTKLPGNLKNYVLAYPCSATCCIDADEDPYSPGPPQSYCAPPLAGGYPARACVVVPALVLTFVMIILGVSVHSFEMVSMGLIAEVLYEPDERRHSYSVLSIGTKIHASVDPHNHWKFTPLRKWLAATYYGFLVAIPLATVALLLILWVVPMGSNHQQRLLRVSMIMDFWSCLDLMALAVFVASTQFSMMADHVQHGKNLERMCTMSKEITGINCIDLRCDLTWGFAALATAGFLSFCVPKLALYGITEDMIEHEAKRQGGKALHEDGLSNEDLSVETHGYGPMNLVAYGAPSRPRVSTSDRGSRSSGWATSAPSSISQRSDETTDMEPTTDPTDTEQSITNQTEEDESSASEAWFPTRGIRAKLQSFAG